MMTIRPLRDQVLVRLDPLELVSSGGLHLPEPAAEAPLNRPPARRATVIAVGPGRRRKRGDGLVPPAVAVGDRVVVNAWMTDSVTGDGRVGLGGDVLIEETDILAIEGEEP